MYSLEWDRIYYRILFSWYALKRFPSTRLSFLSNEGESAKIRQIQQDELAQEKERTIDKEYKAMEREGERDRKRCVLKSLCIHGGFWSCETSSHRSQESDKLGKKLYFASRAAKSIKVMPSAYININDNHIHTHTHTGQEEWRKIGEVCSQACRYCCGFSPTVKRLKKKVPYWYLKYLA